MESYDKIEEILDEHIPIFPDLDLEVRENIIKLVSELSDDIDPVNFAKEVLYQEGNLWNL